MRTNIIAVIMLLINCVWFFSVENSYSAEFGETQIHGYIAQGYLKSTDYNAFVKGTKDGTFQFGEMALTFSTYAVEKLHLGAQFLALDFGDIGNDEIIVDWAFGDYHWKDYLGLRGGLIKIPYGFYNETRDADMLRTNIFLPSGIYPETFRDAFTRIKGLGAYGVMPGGFSYQILYGISDMKPDGPLATGFGRGFGMEMGVEGKSNNIENGLIGIINTQWESLFGLKLGATYINLDGVELDITAGSLDLLIDATKMNAMVGSIEFQYGSFILAYEYALYQLEFFLKGLNASMEGEPEGYYFSGSYRFTSWFSLGAYYSVFHEYRDNHEEAERYTNQLVLTTRFDITENWIMKFEIHKMDGLYFALDDEGDRPREADGNDKDWYLFGVKLAFNF